MTGRSHGPVRRARSLAVRVRGARRLPSPSLRPLAALLDDVALVEHSRFAVPDASSGHCVDDAGRALVLACAMPRDPLAGELARRCLAFLVGMHAGGGRFHLRDGPRADEVRWSDDGSARAIHGIGVAAASAPWRHVRITAFGLLTELSRFESDHLRARSHALLGLLAAADAGVASRAARDAVDRLGAAIESEFATVDGTDEWPWPEERLAYGNALVLEARLAYGLRSRDAVAVDGALHALEWLVATETHDGHLSPTPVGGWALGEPRPGFDQQPLEPWSLADAAWRALDATGDARWGDVVVSAARWFAGGNDARVPMWDPATGRAFDGLEPRGVNRNEGAESALALIGTLLDLRRVEERRGRGVDRQAAREDDSWSNASR